MKTIAVLITCYNRRVHTIRSLNHLFKNFRSPDIYLVDDNSTDGTAETIKQEFPTVKVISGTGNLFWNRGMNVAWQEASKFDYDFYLWMNDDVFLYENSFEELMYCSEKNNHHAIISGIIENKEKDEILYGGSDKNGLIQPNGEMSPIKNLNGNVVLVPKSVYNKLGNLDPRFHHDLGDVDYGLRAQKRGINVLTTRKPIASGTKNNIVRVRKSGVSIKQRFKVLLSPLGSPPSINFYFRRKHYGLINAISFVAILYLLNILPDKIVHLLFGKKYQ